MKWWEKEGYLKEAGAKERGIEGKYLEQEGYMKRSEGKKRKELEQKGKGG